MRIPMYSLKNKQNFWPVNPNTMKNICAFVVLSQTWSIYGIAILVTVCFPSI